MSADESEIEYIEMPHEALDDHDTAVAQVNKIAGRFEMARVNRVPLHIVFPSTVYNEDGETMARVTVPLSCVVADLYEDFDAGERMSEARQELHPVAFRWYAASYIEEMLHAQRRKRYGDAPLFDKVPAPEGEVPARKRKRPGGAKRRKPQ